MPPAVQMEISPRAAVLRQQLGEVAHDARAGRRERMAEGDARAPDVQLGAVDGAQRLVAAEHLLAVVGILPGLQRRQHLRGEGLVDLVEVEVLQLSARRAPASCDTAMVGAISSPSPPTKSLAAACE